MKAYLKVYELQTKEDVRALTKAVKEEKGISSVSIDMKNSIASVRFDESMLTLHKVKIAFLKHGYITGIYRSPEQIAKEEALETEEPGDFYEEQKKKEKDIELRAKELAKKFEAEALARAKEGLVKVTEDRKRIESAKREEEMRLKAEIEEQRQEFERQMELAEARQHKLEERLKKGRKKQGPIADFVQRIGEVPSYLEFVKRRRAIRKKIEAEEKRKAEEERKARLEEDKQAMEKLRIEKEKALLSGKKRIEALEKEKREYEERLALEKKKEEMLLEKLKERKEPIPPVPIPEPSVPEVKKKERGLFEKIFRRPAKLALELEEKKPVVEKKPEKIAVKKPVVEEMPEKKEEIVEKVLEKREKKRAVEENLAWLAAPLPEDIEMAEQIPEMRRKLDKHILPVENDGLLPEPKDIGKYDTSNEAMERLKVKMIFCVILGLPLLYIGLVRWYGLPSTDFIDKHYVFFTFALATPILMISYRLFIKVIRAIFARRPYYHLLAVIAVLLSYIISLFSVMADMLGFNPGIVPVFDISGIVAAAIIAGDFVEAKMHSGLIRRIRRLISIQPDSCVVVKGLEEEVMDSSKIKVGDILNLKRGMWVAADGIVIDGFCTMDESRVTGNRHPVQKDEGDQILQGSLCIDGAVNFRATVKPQGGLLFRIVRKIMDNYAEKTVQEGRLGKVAVFTMIFAAVLALVIFLLQLVFGHGMMSSMLSGLSVLVIVSPSLFILSIPSVVIAVNARASREGVIFNGQTSLAALGGHTAAVTGLRGVLTERSPIFVEAVPIAAKRESNVMRFAANAESLYDDLIATEIQRQAGIHGLKIATATSTKRHEGLGVVSRIRGSKVGVGNRMLMEKLGVNLKKSEDIVSHHQSRGLTVFYVSIGKKLAGLLVMAFRIRPETHDFMSWMSTLSRDVMVLTNESTATGASLAGELKIRYLKGDMDRQGKEDAVRKLTDQGKNILLVKDGVLGGEIAGEKKNHACPVVCIRDDYQIDKSSGITMLKSDPTDISYMMRLGSLFRKRKRQNVVFSYVYNIAVLIYAAGGAFLFTGNPANPIIVVFLMVASPSLLMFNSMRIGRKGG